MLLELPPIPATRTTASQDANRSTSKLRLPRKNSRMLCFSWKQLLELPPIPATRTTASQDAKHSTGKLRLPSENGRMPCFA